MKIQFDAEQGYQKDAVAAVVDLFDGQPREAPAYTLMLQPNVHMACDGPLGVIGYGNRLAIDGDRLRQNLRDVQARNGIEIDDSAAAPAAWSLRDPESGEERACPHFSVEMETGTGKTYVYLRTIYELATRYGFQKFIIVVPSVAIREGVVKNIELTRDHFRALYDNLPCQSFVYDARKINRLRQFATDNTLQIQIINIDAFRKNFTGTDDERKSNVIYKESDKLSGRQPIEFVQAVRPIVIIDEPQSVDSTEKAQEAIKALNPLCTLRYSATHRDHYNLVYRLDPVKAFEMRLVKQIVVAGAAVEGGAGGAFVRVEKIDYKKGIKAQLRIHVQTADGVKEKSVRAKHGDDLFRLSNEREAYRSGYEISEISAEPGNEYVRFAGGQTLPLGGEIGGYREDIWRAQIRHTVKRHLQTESRLAERGIKVLSLFFIDRVANYRDYDESGAPRKGKFALEVEAALAELAPHFSTLEWLKQDPDRLHNGYFAADKPRKGQSAAVWKDTRGDTQADEAVYDLIMRDKERLLSIEEPLRFIFSHSALREGWDNPNVFQICTLNESRSTLKKRQEIGRGLRLPVDQSGRRVFDETVCKLYVMANESYEDFAKALQTEYEEDCGVRFGKLGRAALASLPWVVDGREQPIGFAAAGEIFQALVDGGMIDDEGRLLPAFEPNREGFALPLPPAFADLGPTISDLMSSYRIERHVRRERDERVNRLRKEVQLGPDFQALWQRISARTTYRVEFSTEDLIRRAVDGVRVMPPVNPPKVRVAAAAIQVGRGGVDTAIAAVGTEDVEWGKDRLMPDLLGHLQAETDLTRATLAKILLESGRLAEATVDPQRFLDQVTAVLRHELQRCLVDGIKYERIEDGGAGAAWEMVQFQNEELIDYLNAVSVKKSIYDYVSWDSAVEREFAKRLDDREDIRLFVKLPRWFKVDTPVGGYNPDWAILKHDGRALYLVRETKATPAMLKLRTSEADKIRCGFRHFEAIDVDYGVVVTADEV